MVTPVRRQYLKIKHSYPDAVVLFRLGDFYESFDEDAQLVSRELEITLTARSMGKNLKVPMAGVPAHSLEPYLVRLIKKGYKVAICEQLSDPAASKGLVERDVVRVVTPGTVLESALLEQGMNNYLASVVEDGPLVGLAYVDISTGEFAATQCTPEQLHLELTRISPAEVLAPRTEDLPGWATNNAGLNGVGAYRITALNPSIYDLDTARQALLDHYQILSLESFGCADLPLAVRASGAIVDYLGETHKTGKPQLASLTSYSTASFMTLDVQTRRNLELFQGGRWESNHLSLLSTLDQTRTPMGGRLLRRWIGQPLLNLEELDQRLDAVEFFFDDAFGRNNSRSILAQVPDLERILSRVQTGTVLPRELLALNSGIQARDRLCQQWPDHSHDVSPPEAGQNPTLPNGKPGNQTVDRLLRQLAPVSQVADLIEQAIAPEPAGRVGEGNVIREGFSPELDELKRVSSDARSFIAALESKERQRTGIRNLKVGYNQVFGYYIEVSKSNLAQVPEDYTRRQTLANGERYIVPELKEYESQVLNARARIEEMEGDLYRRVCSQIGDHAEPIGKLAAGIAQVDVYAALAEVAVSHGYVRPSLNLGATISIKDGRHPVVERVLAPGCFVPNDAELSNDVARILVLTGPNMAGKSTFIRQVAIIVLMAQIGGFVPASQATIGLVDRIFTRVGLQDDLTTGQSTFMVEMVETAAILNQATPKSLVILDEVGRGTSTYDGLSIARAVVEHLHNDARLGCKTLFATHYHELTELATTLPGVRNFSVAVAEEEGRVVFLHQIVPGGADRSYGVQVAQLAGLPRGVVNRAREVLEELEETARSGNRKRKRPRRATPPVAQIPLFNLEQPVLEEVMALDIPNLTPRGHQ